MATILNRGDGRRAIQFENLDGERKTLGLGKCPAKAADAIKVKLESLIACRIAQESLDSETARWVASLADSLHERLADFGLIEARHKSKAVSQTVSLFVADFIGGRVDVKSGTITNYRQTESKLVAYFGTEAKLANVTPLDADKFRSWLKGDKASGSGAGLAENSARSIVKNAKLIFGAAVKGKLIAENPFDGHSTAIIERPDRMQFVDRDTIEQVLQVCPNAEWRAILVLCRFGGLRCPSEVLTLRWNDIDFERGRMRVRSPKLEGQQGEFREVPLFPEVRKALKELLIEPDGAEFVIRNQRQGTDTNLRTTLEKIVRKAKVEPWKKLFQNLRSSRETELMEEYPAHVVVKWLGNSLKVAQAHYLQLRDSDFAKASAPIPDSSAAPALRKPSEMLRKASQPCSAGNEKPLVLQGNTTKQGASKVRAVPPAGVEPAHPPWRDGTLPLRHGCFRPGRIVKEQIFRAPGGTRTHVAALRVRCLGR